MGKVKSAICLTLMSLLIAVMCFFCTVTFHLNAVETFHSTVSLTAKDITLGSQLDDDNYLGGGYTAIYYPEGVISAKAYEDDLDHYRAVYNELLEGDPTEASQKTKDAKKQVEDYEKKYPAELRVGGLCLESEVASEDGKTISGDYKAKIQKTFRIMKERYEALHIDGAKLEIVSDYALRITLPQTYSNRNFAFQYMSYSGAITVLYGKDLDSATVILPENKRNAVIGDYLTGFSSRTGADGTSFVSISFTDKGREIVKNATADATSSTDSNSSSNSSSSQKMFFKIGDSENAVLEFSVSSQVDQSTMYISGNYTGESARATAILMDSALEDGDSEDLSVNFYGDDMIRIPALYGDNALMLLYIAFGVCVVAMAVFFFVRYGLLGFAHLFTYLLFLFSMLLCIWAIPFLNMSVGTVIALLLASLVFAVSDAMPYEYARNEYSLGRTMTASVKSAYKKSFWHVFDLHVVLAAFAFILYGVALTGLSSFAFVFGLGIGFSALCSLLVGRLAWASMMAFTPRKGAFCRFKREEVEEDD